MGGGSLEQTQQADGNVSFNPTSIGGGSITVGGNVGNGPVQQGQKGEAGGASVGISASIPMMPLQLVNLN